MKISTYNLMDVSFVSCHLGQVCTAGCSLAERRKEAASLASGSPAWAGQFKSICGLCCPKSLHLPPSPQLSALGPSAELWTRHHGAVSSTPAKIRAASFSEGVWGWATVPEEDLCASKDQCHSPLMGTV